MQSRAAQNCVLFNQFRENGYRCIWTGLKKMALYELVTVCKSTEDLQAFENGVRLFIKVDLANERSSNESFPEVLFEFANPKLPLDVVNDKKCHLLFQLLKEHGLKTFTTPPSLKELVHDLLDIYGETCADVNQAATIIFEKIASITLVDQPHDEYHDVISYLTKHRGVDVNALDDWEFEHILINCVKNILLHLCSVFSTPTTNIFLDATLDSEKINVLWENVLKYLPAILCTGSVELIRLFIRNGCEVENALYHVDFDEDWVVEYCPPEHFDDFLEILDIFMDHGARLNPLPGSTEVPFLLGVFRVQKFVWTNPKLLGFITKCIQRGADPKLSGCFTCSKREDTLLAVCSSYHADDKSELIEFLCDCGADANLYKNNGEDVWSVLCATQSFCSSDENELTNPCLNKAVLTLLRRGLRTGYIDSDGNNVLYMYCNRYSKKLPEVCCQIGWFRDLEESMFWDVVDILLDSGVQAKHVNNNGETPLHPFVRIMRHSCKEEVCSECRQRYFDGELSEAVYQNVQLKRMLKYIGLFV